MIYVENDPSLRAIMTGLLGVRPEVDVLLSAGSPDEALQRDVVERADAALIDLALGVDQMNGIDLGLAMREINENIGVVIHSQYRLDSVARQVPQDARIGWATLAKTGSLTLDTIVDTLRDAAQGMCSMTDGEPASGSPLFAMTIRQRAVMGMMASGINTQEIGRRLGISHAAVRQALTRAYRLGDHFAATALVVHVAQIQQELDHHSDLTLGYDSVALSVHTHSAGGALTGKDFELAERVERIAPGHGAR